MTARDWHALVRPVLPHALNDKDFPELSQVRIELGDQALYAVASDRYTLGAERRALHSRDQYQAMPPVHVRAADLAASLKLFAYNKDDDPDLRVTIDSVPVSAEIVGEERLVSSLGVTLESEDGGRLIMHDRRTPDRDQLAHWRWLLHTAMRRPPGAVLEGLSLGAAHLARWKDAVRGGEVMRLYTGPKPADTVLVTVERHFAGLWVPPQHIEVQAVDSLPWRGELSGAVAPSGHPQAHTGDPAGPDEPDDLDEGDD